MVAGVIFIAQSVGQRKARRDLPVILPIEVVVDGEAVVVGSDNVLGGGLRSADQEVGKLLPGCHAQSGEVMSGVVREGTVVIRPKETEWCKRFDMANIEAVLHAVMAFDPGDGVNILKCA